MSVCLIRYDTEWTPDWDLGPMDGFFERLTAVHRRHDIPCTLFCTGISLHTRREVFEAFAQEVADDPLFDLQCHSYHHIGLCRELGLPLEGVLDDYGRAFALHEDVFGQRPVGVSMCGTGAKDGASYAGFDTNEKTRAQFEGLVSLGLRMIDARLEGHDTGGAFCNYQRLGHPEVMGFPSGNSDTGWLWGRSWGEGWAELESRAQSAADAGRHLPVMLHDWAAWLHPDLNELDHLPRIADHARDLGFELRSHRACLDDPALWSSPLSART